MAWQLQSHMHEYVAPTVAKAYRKRGRKWLNQRFADQRWKESEGTKAYDDLEAHAASLPLDVVIQEVADGAIEIGMTDNGGHEIYLAPGGYNSEPWASEEEKERWWAGTPSFNPSAKIVVQDDAHNVVFRGTMAEFLKHNDIETDPSIEDALKAAAEGKIGLIGGGAAPAVYVALEGVMPSKADLVQFQRNILLACARALFVTAYADKQEDLRRRGKKHVHPGAGGDWMDVAPATNRAALEAAARLLAQIEVREKKPLAELWVQEAMKNDLDPGSSAAQKAFGFSLGMQALGTGVSWADDHKPLGFRLPSIEFHL